MTDDLTGIVTVTVKNETGPLKHFIQWDCLIFGMKVELIKTDFPGCSFDPFDVIPDKKKRVVFIFKY